VLSIDGHAHPAIPSSRKLLVVEIAFSGSSEAEWRIGVHAVHADVSYRPPRRTPKPVVRGLSPATVVGPAGQEIHTDELGRVRVQFPWDREGKRDEHSSLWVRVVEPWAGVGFGGVVLPRIGQEVLVAFLDGDPDQPVISGRVHNALQQVPYKLPVYKTRSTWKSDSSLGSGGFNEIMFEDAAREELVFQQAQKDRQRLVKNDEILTVGHDRQKLVKHDESERTEGYRRIWVGADADFVTVSRVRERIEGGVHTVIRGDQADAVDGDASTVVAHDRNEKVGGRMALAAAEAVHFIAGDAATGESADTTVRGPGGFIRIDGAGVTIVGTVVSINAGGAPGSGPGSHPEPPEEPPQEQPDPPLPPFSPSV
jgi:type VI secretion system secreted protein VgrG